MLYKTLNSRTELRFQKRAPFMATQPKKLEWKTSSFIITTSGKTSRYDRAMPCTTAQLVHSGCNCMAGRAEPCK